MVSIHIFAITALWLSHLAFILAEHAPAVEFCSRTYPVFCGSNNREHKRSIRGSEVIFSMIPSATLTASSTVAPTATADLEARLSAWLKFSEQPVSVVPTLCSCIQKSKACSTGKTNKLATSPVPLSAPSITAGPSKALNLYPTTTTRNRNPPSTTPIFRCSPAQQQACGTWCWCDITINHLRAVCVDTKGCPKNNTCNKDADCAHVGDPMICVYDASNVCGSGRACAYVASTAVCLQRAALDAKGQLEKVFDEARDTDGGLE